MKSILRKLQAAQNGKRQMATARREKIEAQMDQLREDLMQAQDIEQAEIRACENTNSVIEMFMDGDIEENELSRLMS